MYSAGGKRQAAGQTQRGRDLRRARRGDAGLACPWRSHAQSAQHTHGKRHDSAPAQDSPNRSISICSQGGSDSAGTGDASMTVARSRAATMVNHTPAEARTPSLHPAPSVSLLLTSPHGAAVAAAVPFWQGCSGCPAPVWPSGPSSTPRHSLHTQHSTA